MPGFQSNNIHTIFFFCILVTPLGDVHACSNFSNTHAATLLIVFYTYFMYDCARYYCKQLAIEECEFVYPNLTRQWWMAAADARLQISTESGIK